MQTETPGSLVLPCLMLGAALVALASVPYWLIEEGLRLNHDAAERRAAIESTLVRSPARTGSAIDGKLEFTDVARQSREFMEYYRTISLTPEQEAIKVEVLSAMPAACCSDSTALTCCCPCNLSRTIWGLSNYSIARLGADAGQLRHAVSEWLRVTSTNGYSGDACHKGGCEREFKNNGCGGMDEQKLAV